MQFTGMDAEEARAFAKEWLPAWTGNQPDADYFQRVFVDSGVDLRSR